MLSNCATLTGMKAKVKVLIKTSQHPHVQKNALY